MVTETVPNTRDKSAGNQILERRPRAADSALRFQLKAKTEAGARLVSIAESTAAGLALRAAEHDREATYPFEAIESLKNVGYFTAPAPAEFGGLGVSSVHDVLVAPAASPGATLR